MDPVALGLTEWTELGKLLTSLWVVVLFVVLFAFNMIIGHNFLPSFVASGHLPAVWQKVRLFFYVSGFACFAIAVFFFVRVVDLASVLGTFWSDYWI